MESPETQTASSAQQRPALRQKYRPSVRTVLLAVTLSVLLLPLGSLIFFRIYENQLVRETESELVSQGALLAAMLRRALSANVTTPENHGALISQSVPAASVDDPREPLLDLATHRTLPRRPDGRITDLLPDAATARAAEDVYEVFRIAQSTTLSGLRILDHNGVVVAGSGEVGLSFAHVEEIATALRGRYQSTLRERETHTPTPPLASISRGTGVRIFAAFPVLEGNQVRGVVYLSRTPNNILRHMYASRERFLLAGLTILSLALLIGWVTSRTLARPINALSEQARRLGQAGTGAMQPLDHYGTKELAQLGASVLDMAGSLETRARYIRDFAAHVSHEFKTPLTAIRGSAELLSEHAATMQPAERARFIDNILADTDRLRALVDRLNELAKADSSPPAETTVDVVAVIDAVAAARRSDGIAITRTGLGRLSARISPESLEIVLTNLIANAAQAGAQQVTIEAIREDSATLLVVSDNGPGISAGNRARVFEPFFTTRRADGGTGLGLGIVRSLIEAQKGAITLAPAEPGKGASFLVRLPH